MRKKRKGYEVDVSRKLPEFIASNHDWHSSNLRSHYSLEDYSRLKKRCMEDAGVEHISHCKRRLVSIATAPPCGTSSLVTCGRGLKRKLGCIVMETRIGQKKKIEADYIQCYSIGQGKFGSVWLCRSRASSVEFACKTLQKGESTIHREVEIMQHLSGHPGVVTLEAVYEEADCFHLVMELCSGGRLIDWIAKEGPLSEQQAAAILKDLMLVIKYCHDMGVVHRDIKPENILLTTSGQIKLADFGLAVRFSTGQSVSGLAGSPAYVAPEVLSGKYSEKVDIWSAGVVLHALLLGSLPFQGDSLKDVFDAIKNAELDFNSGLWKSVSLPARDLIGRMLTRDVDVRIGADEVLKHPWILFYTERTLKTISVKSRAKNHVRTASFQLPVSSRFISPLNLLPRTTQLLLSPSTKSCKSEEPDEYGFIDVLSVAISHVRISEPKRSKLCCPSGPIEQQHSSNMTSNPLCKAF
ncbi:hypothetical protein SAY87_020605 [Trapa incisa]|uniref:Protein kinase domain-containing protein n=1 Tax=Trapa incisa TaxID=236973 RepID=A0AAN7JRN7_9MYRT|nr:hypothetical protein SAY87_020605 [Trapa incisa]